MLVWPTGEHRVSRTQPPGQSLGPGSASTSIVSPFRDQNRVVRSDLSARLDAIDARLEQIEQLLNHLVLDRDATSEALVADADALSELGFGMTRLATRFELRVEEALAVLERFTTVDTPDLDRSR
jgi:hypothetical protein